MPYVDEVEQSKDIMNHVVDEYAYSDDLGWHLILSSESISGWQWSYKTFLAPDRTELRANVWVYFQNNFTLTEIARIGEFLGLWVITNIEYPSIDYDIDKTPIYKDCDGYAHGETRCDGSDLRVCLDGVWALKERNSPECMEDENIIDQIGNIFGWVSKIDVWNYIKTKIKNNFPIVVSNVTQTVSNIQSSLNDVVTDISGFWGEIDSLWKRVNAIEIPTSAELLRKGKSTINDWIDSFYKNNIKPSIDSLSKFTDNLQQDIADNLNQIKDIQNFIDNINNWFTEQFKTMEDMVINWVVNRFEYILDRIFKEGG